MSASDDLYDIDASAAAVASAFGGGGGAIGTQQYGAVVGGSGNARPMTAVRGAGYTSHGRGTTSAGRGSSSAGRGDRPPSGKSDSGVHADEAPEARVARMERIINNTVTAAVVAKKAGDAARALDKAKAAVKKERGLTALRAKAGMQPNHTLHHTVYLAMADVLEWRGMLAEALSTLQLLAKENALKHSGRVRVNMGNICYKQHKYAEAVKNYRMALDREHNSHVSVKLAVMRNIGNAFVMLGQYQDAIRSFEIVMGEKADFQTCFNLLVCYYALGDEEMMCETFTQLLSIEQRARDVLETLDDDNDDDEIESPGRRPPSARRPPRPSEFGGDGGSKAGEAARKSSVVNDGFREYVRDVTAVRRKSVIQAAKLLAPTISASVAEGYDWVISEVKAAPSYAHLANELEIAKALSFLGQREFEVAATTLKSFAGANEALAATAATNLSFLTFLEGDVKAADKHASQALTTDRYNAQALVNKGNCFFAAKEFEKASDIYMEALSVEADCSEALYNLGLSQARLGDHNGALDAFEKLNAIDGNNFEVVFMIGTMYGELGALPTAIEWFTTALQLAPHDPSTLVSLGGCYERAGDRAQAYACFQEAHRHYPSNVEVIRWLGGACVRDKVYDQAIRYFEQGAVLQPDETVWVLMIASCHRRMGGYQRALGIYRGVLDRLPDNAKALEYAEVLCRELGLEEEARKYGARLRQLRNTRPSAGQGFDPEDFVNDGGGEVGSGGGGAYYGGGTSSPPQFERVADPTLVDRAPEVPDEDRNTRKVAGTRNVDDEDWGDDHIDDLLPDDD